MPRFPGSCWLFWIFFVLCLPFADGFRFGEASHPGPVSPTASASSEPCYRLAIGTANVAGLSNKVGMVMDLPPGIWSLTETHLTEPGFRFIRKAFAAHGKDSQRSIRLQFGAPAPSRTVDSQSGTWTGVCTVSDFPAQALTSELEPDIFQCGRTLISSHHVGHVNVVVGTVYGVAQSPTFRDPLSLTRTLLQSISEQVVDRCRGPRCIQGDFNVDVMQFPEMRYWHSLGWRELQLHTLEQFHKPVEATCKGSTVRDFVWCSPELLHFLESTSVIHDSFPDHSAVCGFFRFPDSVPVLPFWPTPNPIPWDMVDQSAWRCFVDTTWTSFTWDADSARGFARWSSSVERSLTGFVHTPHGRLPPGCGGRGQHLQPKKGRINHPQVKAARPGEEQMTVAFPNRTLLLWYRQLRRVQSLLHGLRKGTDSPPSWTYQAQCWSSIIRASRFSPSFREWWSRRPVRLQSSPTVLDGLPPLAHLEAIFTDFRLNFRQLETWHQRQASKQAQLRKESSLKCLFRDFRPDGPAPLDFVTRSWMLTPLLAKSWWIQLTILLLADGLFRVLLCRFGVPLTMLLL